MTTNLNKYLKIPDAGSGFTHPPLHDLVRTKSPAKPVMKIERSVVKVKPTTLAYIPANRKHFCECDFDLGEIGRAATTESIIKISFDKHLTLCLKEGFKIVGKDPSTVAYISKRLFEFELATTIPFKEVVKETMSNVISYANAFTAFRRDRRHSSGRPYTKFEKLIEPIAGIFPADPTSMLIKRNKFGEVKKYQQVIRGGAYAGNYGKEFSPIDILHVAHNRHSGFAWGTPFVISVLDDVRLLRNIEELTNLAIHKGTFPLIHWKVGTEKRPVVDFQDGSSEITDVENEIQNRDSEGVFVTSERHEIQILPIEFEDLTKYLEYFRNRVMSGLNLTTVDLGEGGTSNKSTAGSMMKSMQHKCKDFQASVEIAFTTLFDDLLTEGGFQITQDNRVEFVFPEIDIETQQAVYNHAMALYQGHAISEDEMRSRIDMEPITDDQRDKMFLEVVEKNKIEAQSEVKADAQVKLTQNKNRPSNQSGTKASSGSRKNDEGKVLLLENRLNTLFSEINSKFLKSPKASLKKDAFLRVVNDEIKDIGIVSEKDKIDVFSSAVDTMSSKTSVFALAYIKQNILDHLRCL